MTRNKSELSKTMATVNQSYTFLQVPFHLELQNKSLSRFLQVPFAYIHMKPYNKALRIRISSLGIWYLLYCYVTGFALLYLYPPIYIHWATVNK